MNLLRAVRRWWRRRRHAPAATAAELARARRRERDLAARLAALGIEAELWRDGRGGGGR